MSDLHVEYNCERFDAVDVCIINLDSGETTLA